MLFALTLFFHLITFADPTEELSSCITNVLINRGHTYSSIEMKRIAQGESSITKEFRKHMADSVPGSYDKHIRAKTVSQAKELSKTGLENAQYMPGLNRINLEKHALVSMKGFYKSFESGGKLGTIYKFVKFQDDIGFDSGEATKWLRVEWSSGSYHGHPISLDRLKKQCSDCTP